MINYETLMLSSTEITDDEINAIEQQMDKLVSSRKGKLSLFDKWGKYKLSYPVRKNMYGIYILVRFQVPEESVDSFFEDLDSFFRIKYNDLIMRHVIIKLGDEVSSIYPKPEPIGSHRTSNLGSFIKENKMEGLIDTPVEKKEKKEAESKEEKTEERKDEVAATTEDNQGEA